MRIQKLHIKNFRYIRSLEICDIENALILVGKNNVGKTAVLSALCAVGGQYEIAETDFNEKKQNIEIDITLEITQEDLELLHRLRKVSSFSRLPFQVIQLGLTSILPVLNPEKPELLGLGSALFARRYCGHLV